MSNTNIAPPKLNYSLLLRTNRDFRRLWLGQLISFCGSWFNSVAVLAMVYHYTGTGLAAGLSFALQMLPGLFASAYAGVIADRYNRRTIMVVTDVMMAILVLGFWLADSPSSIWFAYPLTFALSITKYFFMAARIAWMPSLVKPDEYILLTALTQVNSLVFQALGGLLGGLSVVVFGWQVAFIFNSLAFGLSAALTFSVRSGEVEGTGVSDRLDKKTNIWQSFQQGINEIRYKPLIKAIFLVDFVYWLGMGGLGVAMSYLALKTFKLGDGGVGLFYAAQGIGGLITLLFIVPYLARWEGPKQLALMGWICIGEGIVITLFGFANVAGLALFLYALNALVALNYGVVASSVMLRALDQNVRGRVFSLLIAIITGAGGISALVFGALLDWIGTTASLSIVGFFAILPGVVWLWGLKTGYIHEETS